jgi:hypothetical protein
LKFRLKGFLEKLASLGEKEGIEVIEGLTVGSGVGDEVAFRKQGIKFRVKKGVNFGGGKTGLHHYVRVKEKLQQNIRLIPTKKLHTPNAAKLNQTGGNVVFSLYNEDRYQARAIAKYYLDMQDMTKKVSHILAPRGMAVFVIGDTEYKGIRVENAKHLVESLSSNGFHKVFVTKRKISNKMLTPYRDTIGRFTTNSESRKVYSEEFIVVAKKS